MANLDRIAFVSSDASLALSSLASLEKTYGNCDPSSADVIVALGGDGFMLQTLHAAEHLEVPVYGMNRGTVGFLMNAYSEDNLADRLAAAEEQTLHPLRMEAKTHDGTTHQALAINEVSLLRQGPQAAVLRVIVDGRVRMNELVCDGAMVATPAGSTAYNYSAHGPILPIDADVLALTAVAAFRPRRWRGALLPKTATVHFEVLKHERRAVMAEADSRLVRDVTSVTVTSELSIKHRLLFDAGHGLDERLVQEQFM